MHDVVIRAAQPHDVAAIAGLAGELGYPTADDVMRARIDAVLAAPHEHVVLVAVADGIVAGWIQISAVTSIESGTFAEIRGLVVLPTHRSRGIGTRLVTAGEAWTHERGIPRLRVRSNVTRTRTHAFYEQRGYAVTKSQNVFDKPLG